MLAPLNRTIYSMNAANSKQHDAAADAAAELFEWVRELQPMRRCITGEGLRETIAWVGEHVPVETSEVPTGTPALDWSVPEEWRVREAYLEMPDGSRIACWSDSPLHLVQYSVALRTEVTFADLLPHLHTLPEQPDLIPYRTSYYVPTWGFCLPHNDLLELQRRFAPTDVVQVVVDADHLDGSLTYGEIVIPGTSPDEILLSAHACHPALANDNASSIAIATALALRRLNGPKRRHTLRVLFAPGTIGAIVWLSRNRERLNAIRGGLVLANLGDAGAFTYKASRRGTLNKSTPMDAAMRLALRDSGSSWSERPFDPSGYDERQFGSPGFDLPVGRLTRTPHNEYPEYHTSADDMKLVKPESLHGSLLAIEAALEVMDGDGAYRNLAPYGEPMLGRYDLYSAADGTPLELNVQKALMWVLNLSDGSHTLAEISSRSGLAFAAVRAAADRLCETDLLAEVSHG